MQTSSISFRAPRWQTSAPNMVHSPQTRQIMDDESRVAPVVLRTETFAKQVSGGRPVYTQPPGSSRYQGGTADGGLWFMPPEVGGEDRDDALAPSGRSISTSVLGIGAGVRLGFGAPHIDTGHIVNGHWLKDDGGDLVVEKLNASGSPTEAFRFTTEGAMIFEDIGGDPASPASGFVALYVKSGNFHQKDSGGTVTSLV